MRHIYTTIIGDIGSCLRLFGPLAYGRALMNNEEEQTRRLREEGHFCSVPARQASLTVKMGES